MPYRQLCPVFLIRSGSYPLTYEAVLFILYSTLALAYRRRGYGHGRVERRKLGRGLRFSSFSFAV